MNISSLFNKHRQMFTYIIYSIFTAVIEAVIGWALLKITMLEVVTANTVSIFIGTVIHYFLITKSTFKSNVNVYNIAVYLSTFFLGLIIQNYVVFLGYNKLLTFLGESYRFFISKGLSLCVSFLILFFLRKLLYSLTDKIYEKNNIRSNKDE